MTKCAGCRVRHLTCNARSPCTECEKGGRECVRLNVRFRHLACPSKAATPADYSKYEFFFDEKQTWIDTQEQLEFVAETDLAADVSPANESEDIVSNPFDLNAKPQPSVVEQPSSMSTLETTSETPVAHTPISDDQPPDYLAALEQIPYNPPANVLDSSMGLSAQPLGGVLSAEEKPPSDTGLPYLVRVSSAQPAAWPLQNVEEGKLLQHFITHLAPWFDVGDTARHFGKIAPCMAASSPLLMTAILAIATLHQSRISCQSDSHKAMVIHDRCLSMIVPMLGDSDRANDDCVLMTTTILHLYDGLETGNDLPRHLKGTSIFFPAEAPHNPSRLRRAVFWLHLRQEIYNAYLYQRSVVTDLSNCNFESESQSGDDDSWFHRTLYIAAQVTKWAFGGEASYSRWNELCDMLDEWESRRPTSFSPLLFRERDPNSGRYFPELCFATDEPVAAAHFIHLAKLLLTTHDPNLPRIGPRVKSAAAAMQETVLSYVRTLVGIALSNTWMPARFTANLAVIICASWFTDRWEQEALLDILQDTSRCSGLAREGAQRALLEAWGWRRE